MTDVESLHDLCVRELGPLLAKIGEQAIARYLGDRGDAGMDVARALQAGSGSLRFTFTTAPFAYMVDFLSDDPAVPARTLLTGELTPLAPAAGSGSALH